MAREIPGSENFTGLSRKVIKYSERFGAIMAAIKEPDFSNEMWDKLEELVDVDNFVSQGVFLTETPETIDWKTYKDYMTQYPGATQWEARLRHITEQGHPVLPRDGRVDLGIARKRPGSESS